MRIVCPRCHTSFTALVNMHHLMANELALYNTRPTPVTGLIKVRKPVTWLETTIRRLRKFQVATGI